MKSIDRNHPYILAIIENARNIIAQGGNNNLFKGAVILARLLPHGFITEAELTAAQRLCEPLRALLRGAEIAPLI